MAKKNKIKQIEKYVYHYRWRLVLLVGLVLIINIISSLPYLNLIITFPIKTLIIWVGAINILKLPSESTFLVSFVLIFLGMVSSIRGRDIFAEEIGVTAFYLFVLGIVILFKQYRTRQ